MARGAVLPERAWNLPHRLVTLTVRNRPRGRQRQTCPGFVRCASLVGEIRDVVVAHSEEIKLLARRHALSIKVFGSVAQGEDHQDPDIDLLVEFGPGPSILDQVHLGHDLRALLDCDVDVVPIGGLKARDAHLLAEAVSPLREATTYARSTPSRPVHRSQTWFTPAAPSTRRFSFELRNACSRSLGKPRRTARQR